MMHNFNNLGESYKRLCLSEGISAEDIANGTGLAPFTVKAFFNGAELKDETRSNIRKAINHHSPHLTLTSDNDVRKYSTAIYNAGGLTEVNIEQAIKAVTAGSGQNFESVRNESSRQYNPGSGPFEKEYYMAKHLGYKSIKDLLEDPRASGVLPKNPELLVASAIPSKPYGDELAISVHKLIRAIGINQGELADYLQRNRTTISYYLQQNYLSAPIKDKIPGFMSKYGDYDTPEKIIKAAKNLESMPEDEMLYRASIWKLKKILGIHSTEEIKDAHGKAGKRFDDITKLNTSISESALRAVPAILGFNTMQEVIDAANITPEDMQNFLNKNRRPKKADPDMLDCATPTAMPQIAVQLTRGQQR